MEQSSNIPTPPAFQPGPTVSRDQLAGEFRRVAMSNPRFLAIAAGSIFAIVFLVTMFIEWSNLELSLMFWKNDMELIDYSRPYNTPETIVITFKVLFLAMLCIGASAMFPELADRNRRISFLMRPVQPIVKLLPQFLTYIVGPTVVFVVSFLICDILRVILFSLYTIGQPTHFTTVWPYLFSDPDVVTHYLRTGLPLTLFIASIFMVGSVAWPRNSFVKTFCMLGLFCIVELCVVGVMAVIISSIFSSAAIRDLPDPTDHPWLICFFLLAGACFNIFLTWLRLTDTDAITHK